MLLSSFPSQRQLPLLQQEAAEARRAPRRKGDGLTAHLSARLPPVPGRTVILSSGQRSWDVETQRPRF